MRKKTLNVEPGTLNHAPQRFSAFPIGARFRYAKQGRMDQSCFPKLSATTYGVDGMADARTMEGDPLVLSCGHSFCQSQIENQKSKMPSTPVPKNARAAGATNEAAADVTSHSCTALAPAVQCLRTATVEERREYLEWLAIYFLTHDRVARLEDLKPELRELAVRCGWVKPAGSAGVLYVPAGELEEMIGS